MVDLKRLKELAEAATPGKWEWEGREQDADGWVHIPECSYLTGGISLVFQHEGYQNDCDFIAAANPKAVLELIEEIERLRAELAVRQGMNIDIAALISMNYGGLLNGMDMNDAIRFLVTTADELNELCPAEVLAGKTINTRIEPLHDSQERILEMPFIDRLTRVQEARENFKQGGAE